MRRSRNVAACAGLALIAAAAIALNPTMLRAQEAGGGAIGSDSDQGAMMDPSMPANDPSMAPPLAKMHISQPITGSMLAAPPYGLAPMRVGFFVLADDPEGLGFLTYSWNFGDTSLGTSASFIKSDSTTQGNWIGTYGTQGYNIIGDATSYLIPQLKVAVEFFNLDGTRKYFTEISNFSIGPNASREAITLPRIPNLDPTYLVRGVLMSSADKDASDKDKVLAENVYWESTTDDDLGEAKNDEQFKTTLAKWADLSALNTMPRSDLNVSTSSQAGESNGEKQVTITLANPGNHVAFFVRAEVTQGSEGSSDRGEILPIIYDDNYVTIFPHETRTIEATFQSPGTGPSSLAVRVEGYNVAKQVLGVR